MALHLSAACMAAYSTIPRLPGSAPTPDVHPWTGRARIPSKDGHGHLTLPIVAASATAGEIGGWRGGRTSGKLFVSLLLLYLHGMEFGNEVRVM